MKFHKSKQSGFIHYISLLNRSEFLDASHTLNYSSILFTGNFYSKTFLLKYDIRRIGLTGNYIRRQLTGQTSCPTNNDTAFVKDLSVSLSAQYHKCFNEWGDSTAEDSSQINKNGYAKMALIFSSMDRWQISDIDKSFYDALDFAIKDDMNSPNGGGPYIMARDISLH